VIVEKEAQDDSFECSYNEADFAGIDATDGASVSELSVSFVQSSFTCDDFECAQLVIREEEQEEHNLGVQFSHPASVCSSQPSISPRDYEVRSLVHSEAPTLVHSEAPTATSSVFEDAWKQRYREDEEMSIFTSDWTENGEFSRGGSDMTGVVTSRQPFTCYGFCDAPDDEIKNYWEKNYWDDDHPSDEDRF
jgi:hypothetical protein